MKKTLLLFILLSFCIIGNTQTNIFPDFGNAGIGTTSPSAGLQVNVHSSSTYQSGLQINGPGLFPFGTPVNSLFEIRNAGFVQGTFQTLFKVGINHKIGMGLAQPKSKLHVHNGRIQITGNNTYGGPMLLLGGSSTDAPNGQWGIEYIGGGVSGLNFWKPDGSAGNGFGNYFMFLADNGKISIGLDPNDPSTYEGDYNLYVGEGIMTEKVKVAVHATDDWADYVFEKDYELLSLPKLEEFIIKEGHLPNVPSAEEVVDQGIDMAKMDAKLLEKIEELTLYMIEQDKRIKELESQLKKD